MIDSKAGLTILPCKDPVRHGALRSVKTSVDIRYGRSPTH